MKYIREHCKKRSPTPAVHTLETPSDRILSYLKTNGPARATIIAFKLDLPHQDVQQLLKDNRNKVKKNSDDEWSLR